MHNSFKSIALFTLSIFVYFSGLGQNLELFKDINPEGSSTPRFFVSTDSLLFFTAQDPTGTWLNTLEEEANGATANFYRIVGEEEGLWKFREYYRSGDLLKTGQYTDSNFTVKKRNGRIDA